MAKAKRSALLNRLAGKKLVFDGPFRYGVLDDVKAMARVHQGTVQEELDAKTDYLVLAELNASKTAQKKMQSLIKKGATIQMIDVESFEKLVELNEEILLELLRTNDSESYIALCLGSSDRDNGQRFKIRDANLRGAALADFRVFHCRFKGCDFTGAELDHVWFDSAENCDFSEVKGKENVRFSNVTGSRFSCAELDKSSFMGDLAEAKFDGASLRGANFTGYAEGRTHFAEKTSFARAKLSGAEFHGIKLKAPNFANADLSQCSMRNCSFERGDFRGVSLRGASMMTCKLTNADFSNADLTGANLARADLTGVKLAGADLNGVNLRGATLKDLDFSKAKNYDAAANRQGTIGPALKELDALLPKVKRVGFSFVLRSATAADLKIAVDSSAYQYGNTPKPWVHVSGMFMSSFQAHSYSKQLLELADNAAHLRVGFETIEVSSSKSPVSGKELRELVMRAISEAFAQEPPAEEELAAATKKRKEMKRDEQATTRLLRTEAKLKAEKAKEKEKKQIAKKIEKAVGKVTDIASFTKALEVRIEKPKIQKATQMLKASGFKLFNDVTEESVSGVVKSQTDPDLVYACRIDQNGKYSCCTQNLNVCGGLRGSLCKHQLVLIIGLVQAGELDPTTIDGWIAKTHNTKAELDKESMGEIFIKYKGAEAGEIDWRPTETVPEDYYAL